MARSSRSCSMNAVSRADSCGFMPAVGSSSRSRRGGRERAGDLDAALVAIGEVVASWPKWFSGRPSSEHLARLVAHRHPPCGPRGTQDRAEQPGLHARVLTDHHVLRGRHRGEQADVLKSAGDPQRVMMSGRMPVTSVPPKMIRPSVGLYRPHLGSMLKNVVLPAPFGSMIETIERGLTSNETSSTATRPPNDLVTCSVASSASADSHYQRDAHDEPDLVQVRLPGSSSEPSPLLVSSSWRLRSGSRPWVSRPSSARAGSRTPRR